MKTNRGVLLCLAILSIIGCKDNITEPDKSGILYPLNIGNFWKYKIELLDSINYKSSKKSFTERVERDTTINNENWSLVKTNDDIGNEHYNRYRNRTDGFYEYYGKYDIYLLYKYPCTVNESFKQSQQHTVSIKVINTSETVSTPLGNFKCIVYQYSFDYPKDIFQNIYIAQGIGRIKEEYVKYPTQNQPNVLMRVNLVEYNLN